MNATNDELQSLDSMLYKEHKGQLDNESKILLPRFKDKLGVTGAECAERLKAVLVRKQAAADEKEAAENPPFIDDGVILVHAPPMADMFLAFTRGQLRDALCIDEHLVKDGKQLPDLSRVRLHRVPSDSKAEFERLCHIVEYIAGYAYHPGQVCTVRKTDERTGRSKLPVILSDNPPIGFETKIDGVQFLRGPGQSQKDFDAALSELRENCAKQAGVESMRPVHRTRPVYA